MKTNILDHAVLVMYAGSVVKHTTVKLKRYKSLTQLQEVSLVINLMDAGFITPGLTLTRKGENRGKSLLRERLRNRQAATIN